MQLHAVASLSKMNGSNDSLLHTQNGTQNGGGVVQDKNKNKQMQIQAISNGHTGVVNGDARKTESRTQLVSPAKASSPTTDDEGLHFKSSARRSSTTDSTKVESPPAVDNKDAENGNNTSEVGMLVLYIYYIFYQIYIAIISCKYTFKNAVHRTLKNEFTHKIHTQYVNTNHIVTLKI